METGDDDIAELGGDARGQVADIDTKILESDEGITRVRAALNAWMGFKRATELERMLNKPHFYLCRGAPTKCSEFMSEVTKAPPPAPRPPVFLGSPRRS